MKDPALQHRETALQEALLEELLGRSGQAIVLLDTAARVLYCSPGIQAITGHDPATLSGQTAFDFFHPADLPAAHQQHHYLTHRNGNTAAGVIQVRHQQGHLVWIDVEVRNLLHLPAIGALFVLLKRSGEAGAEERRLAQAVVDAREQERAFLASELHDNINQVITATRLLVDAARFSPEKDDLLRLSSANLQYLGEETRKLSYTMAGHGLQEQGLAQAVDTFLATLNRVSKTVFEASFDAAALEALGPDQQRHVYRMIQEGSNNIIRHAGATRAEISLRRRDGIVYLVISDNGKGFAVNGPRPGMGLSGMINRVKLLGGHFHIRAPQDTGTTIEIHFPV